MERPHPIQSFKQAIDRVVHQKPGLPPVANEQQPQPALLPIEGQTYTSFFDHFLAYANWKEHLDAQAVAQGVPVYTLMPPEWRRIHEAQLQWDNEIKARNRHSRREHDAGVRLFDAQLAQEVEAAGFSQMATLIQDRMWYDGSSTPAATIQRSGRLEVTTNADGTQRDLSRLGVTVSYTYDKATNAAVRKPAQKKQEKKTHTQHDADVLEYAVSFGIGHFGNREQILPDAQHAVSDEDLERGVKCYYIQRTYYSQADGYRTEMVAIPMGFVESDQTFITWLYDAADHTPGWLTMRRMTKYEHRRFTKKAA